MGWSGPLSSVLTNPLLSSHLECLHWLGAGPPSGDPNHPALGWAPAVCYVVRPRLLGEVLLPLPGGHGGGTGGQLVLAVR